jgi:hypothetical protein
MQLNTPILVNWKRSSTAEFIRRHQWFFRVKANYGLGSLFNLICVYVPLGCAIIFLGDTLHDNPLLAALVYMVGAFIMIEAALEGSRR